MAGSNKKVIYAALIGNALISVTKFAAAAFTGSSAMLAEGIHSVVDTGNQLLLLFGLKRAKIPADDRYPFGHGKEIYFWSFIVAMLIFAVGAAVSIYKGVHHVIHPTEIQNAMVNYIVLGLAMVFEGAAWFMAFKEFTKAKGKWGYLEAVHRGKDPSIFVVLFEDSAAMIGLVVAFLGVLTAANVGMYLASWALVGCLQRVFATRTLNTGRPSITRGEVLLSFLVVLINIGVGVAGWLMWTSGPIVLVEGSALRVLGDFALIVLFFDVAMYAFHRLMHVGWLFTRIHAAHHRQVDTSGLSFFIMNPMEAVGFGVLLLVFLVARPFSIDAVLLFLALNWAYGTMGHSGLRLRTRFWRWVVGDSELHHAHHELLAGNYGFFTPIWDRVFGSVVSRP